MVGRTGLVTADITPGHLGEIKVAIRGGSEAFNAYGSESAGTIRKGARVMVVDYFPPRTVVVSPI